LKVCVSKRCSGNNRGVTSCSPEGGGFILRGFVGKYWRRSGPLRNPSTSRSSPLFGGARYGELGRSRRASLQEKQVARMGPSVTQMYHFGCRRTALTTHQEGAEEGNGREVGDESLTSGVTVTFSFNSMPKSPLRARRMTFPRRSHRSSKSGEYFLRDLKLLPEVTAAVRGR
jgi:hypothetical protein